VTDKLSRFPLAHPSALGLPPCPECGAVISFAAASGGAIEWWRCTGCQRFFPVRTNNCPHDPGVAGRCARCGGAHVAITITLREGPEDITMHFCSLAHARESLGDA
jgi:hypothetical protein